ncbi:MAG TPA: hypothetical protein ENK02_14420 [Planctomycetes bacterium]|nr:hypothetical protein [Planctomycetota bacterium]
MRDVRIGALILCLAGCRNLPSPIKSQGLRIPVSVFGVYIRQPKPGFWIWEFLSDYGLLANDKGGLGSWGFFNKRGGPTRKMFAGKLTEESRLVEGGGPFFASLLPYFQRESASMLNDALAKFCVEAQESGFRVFKLAAVREDGFRKTRLDMLNLREHVRRKMKVSSFQGFLLEPKSGVEQRGVHVVPFMGDLSGAYLNPMTRGRYRKIAKKKNLQLEKSQGEAILRGWLKLVYKCPNCKKEVWSISYPKYPIFYGVDPKGTNQRLEVLRLILSLKWKRQLWEKIRAKDGGSVHWEKKKGEFVPGKLFGLCEFCHKEVLLSFYPIQKRPEFAFLRLD